MSVPDDITCLIITVDVLNFDSFFGNFFLNRERSNINGFVRAMDSIEVAISENWSIVAIQDFFVKLVGKVDDMYCEFYICDSLKQSTELSFCDTSWYVILFAWFPIHQQITKEMHAPDLLVFVFSHEAKSQSLKLSSSEFSAALSIGDLFTGNLCSEVREKVDSGVCFEVVEYSSSQCLVYSI